MRNLRSLALLACTLAGCAAAPSGGNGDGGGTGSGDVDGHGADVDAGDRLDATPGVAGTWVSGYYVGYQRDLYPPAEVDFSAITHLIVGRIRPLADGRVDTAFDIDPTSGPEMALDLSSRAHAAGRQAILMVGGAGEHDGWVAAADDATRSTFVANLLATMDQLHYDGLDLDWEPVETVDQPDLAALIHDLRAARPSIVLTIPVGWVNANFPDVDPFYAQIADEVDQINLMSYGMADNWGGWLSWHSSALEGEGGTTPSSVASSVDAHLAAGVPAAKLGVGIGFYGSCWDGGVTAPRQALTSGGVVASDNDMSYANIMRLYYSASAYHYDAAAEAPYLGWTSAHGPNGCTFLSYEDEASVAAKGAYVRAHGLGGTIIWTVNQGHRADLPAGQRDPLLAAVRAAFLP